MTAASEARAKAKQTLALTSNYATAYAVKAADVDVIAVYPITPQTTIVEKISEFVDEGELRAQLIHVESEHSAMSAAVGAAAVGARTFTATSSQGLELLHEMLHIASGLRLPIVMAVPARALSAPICIHGDYSDVMNTRDTGWITLIASSAQEVYDSIIQAYKIAESVLLPVMVAYDGFLMSHTTEAVELNDEEDVRKWLPRRLDRPNILTPEKPITMGVFAMPDYYYEIKYQAQEALLGSLEKIAEVDREYGKAFGRSYGIVQSYRLEDADYVIVAYGGAWGNVREAVDEARRRGIGAGALRLRVWRPYPADEVAKALAGVKAFAVVDRAIAFGAPAGGPVYIDTMTALRMRGIDTPGLSVIHGIGQRSMFVEDFVKVFKILKDGEKNKTVYMGLRL